MPKNSENLNRQLFDLLKSKGYDPTTLDTSGKETPVPEEAEVFQFDFTKDGEDYGKVTVSIDGLHKLIIYYGDNVANSSKSKTNTSDDADWNNFIDAVKDFKKSHKQEKAAVKESDSGDDSWYGLLRHLKKFAKNRQLSFELKNSNHLKHDMAKREYMKNKEKISEGYYPMGKKASYSDAVPNVKIVIEHTRQIEEGEQRYRNVNRIFLENQAGERFLLDTKQPGIARVYARHIAEGGKVNDERWGHINSLCEEYKKMSGFVRAVRNGQFNESAQQLVNEGINHYQSLRETLSKMTGHRGYNTYFESWTPSLMEDEVDTTSLNELFVQETLDPRIESVMPILSKLHKQVAEMKEVGALAEWADSLLEGGDGGEASEEPVEPIDENSGLQALNPQGIPEGKPGLWANIHAKRERIKHGSGEKMRKPGSKGAPTAQAFKDAAKESIDEGKGTSLENIISYLRDTKPGLDLEGFLDEVYMYADASFGKEKADEIFQHEDYAEFEDWYDRYKGVSEGFSDIAKKVGSALKTGARAVGRAIVGPDDDELLRDLKKRAGVHNPETGKPSMAISDVEKVNKEGVAEGFGSNYAEQLAQEVFNHNPNIKDENQVLNLGYNISKSDLGSRAQGIFRDEDFPSDFLSAYFYLQKQGVTEGLNPNELIGYVYDSKNRYLGTWNGQRLVIDPNVWKKWKDENGQDWASDTVGQARDKIARGIWKVHQEQQGVTENVDIGQEWMSDTELDQYVPDALEQEWRELVGYDANGNAHPLWINMTGEYEPKSSDPQHRAWMVKVANKWFAMKKIPNVKFFDVKDSDTEDELEWLVQIGKQGVAEGVEPYEFGEDAYMDIIQDLIDRNRRNMSPSRKPRVMAAVKRIVNSEGGVFDPILFGEMYDRIVSFSRDMYEEGVAEGSEDNIDKLDRLIDRTDNNLARRQDPARYQDIDVDKSAKIIYWVTQETTSKQSQEFAIRFAKILKNNGFNGWTVKVVRRDFYNGKKSPWKVASVEQGVTEGEFAGNYKTGPEGQWRNKGPKANKPAKVGDLVGASESFINTDAQAVVTEMDKSEDVKGPEGKAKPITAAKAKKDFGRVLQNNIDKANKAKQATDEKVKQHQVKEEVDTGEADARKTTPSSKEEDDKVFAKHRERMKNLDKEDKKEVKEGQEDLDAILRIIRK